METKDMEVLKSLEEKYQKARKLLEEDAKSDPETQPYRSKYLASSILKEMKCTLDKISDEVSSECKDFIRFKAMLGAVNLNLGIIAVDTEELSTGEEHLLNCLEGISEYNTTTECIIVTLSALNQLGILWAERHDTKNSQLYLEKAEAMYKMYKGEESQKPVEINDLFLLTDSETGLDNAKQESSLESVHTLTLYYLAQVYSTLKDHDKAAIYCHTTLRRQLESKKFDAIDWALNAATLSQYFLERNGYVQARHHLAAASYILNQYDRDETVWVGPEKETDENYHTFIYRCADVDRCWGKYGLALLTASKEHLMARANDDDDESRNTETEMQISSTSHASQEEVQELWFSSLEMSDFEETIGTKLALTFEDAREIFRHARKCFLKTQEYYTKESHASDFVQIVQDMSQLFKNLIFFEEDKERQCRMHKRRALMLEDVLKDLNPQYYLLVCRQLWFELGEIYSDMLEIKLTRLRETNDEQLQTAIQRKIYQLAEKSITNFKTFLDSLKDTHSKRMPDSLGEDVMRPALIAHFYLGRLYSQLPTVDSAKVENVRKSLECYEFLVEYCEQHPESEDQMRSELSVCRDMVKLLPLKIERLMSL